MGVAYSLLASALWPLVAMIVPESRMSTAYGLLQAIQNLGLGTVALMSGYIVDRFGYLWLELFFSAWLVVSLISIVIVYVLDLQGDKQLNMHATKRHEVEREKKLAKKRAKREAFKAGYIRDRLVSIDRPE